GGGVGGRRPGAGVCARPVLRGRRFGGRDVRCRLLRAARARLLDRSGGRRARVGGGRCGGGRRRGGVPACTGDVGRGRVRGSGDVRGAGGAGKVVQPVRCLRRHRCRFDGAGGPAEEGGPAAVPATGDVGQRL